MTGSIHEILTKLYRDSHRVSYYEACDWLGVRIESSYDFQMSADEFRHLALQSKSEKATKIREYYIRIESLLYEGLRGNTILRLARGNSIELDLAQIQIGLPPLPKQKPSRYAKKRNGKFGNVNSMRRNPDADRLIIEIYEKRAMSVADVHFKYNKLAAERGLPLLSYGTVYGYIKSLEFYKNTIKSIHNGKID